MRARLGAAVAWVWRYLLAAVVLRYSTKRTVRRDRELPASTSAETWTAILLFAAALAALAFVAIYAFDDANTQLLGLSIAVALALIAAALILAASSVVPQETLEEPRPEFTDVDGPKTQDSLEFSAHQREGVEGAALTLREGSDGVTRRRLLKAAGGAAGVGLGAAALAPLASLGPAVGDRLDASPWKDGVRLVEENGMPAKAADLEVGSFLTAFADGADKEQLASSLAVVRVRPEELELPEDRADWAPEGILAFSKICTHAQCAISLFRYPLFAERSPGPALVCPCHYSTFNVLDGGERIFGPAVRPLPQLPLRIEGGILVAAGPLSGAVGASWGRVKEEP
ncbi:MAG TPA: ubiquinol-cytochrome c reductase iron-sulfur subunit [Solirubrobacterales bacterium]|jgi:ubiquinol-cytochrome c reductase iron-sulfur subunit|nr:ubiquinol-cytochrome c reductase iron-sulfur subunit [Solirubrobacterales bacterium]